MIFFSYICYFIGFLTFPGVSVKAVSKMLEKTEPGATRVMSMFSSAISIRRLSYQACVKAIIIIMIYRMHAILHRI